MRAGILGLCIVAAAVAAGPAWADAIVRVVNNSGSAVIVRVDGNYGCRALSKTTAPPDVESGHCSFGTNVGSHVLEFRYDDGKTGSKSVSVPATGFALTLTGSE